MDLLQRYYQKVPIKEQNKTAIAYLAALDVIAETSPLLSAKIIQELNDQRSFLKLIASENYCSLRVQLAMGNLLTDKYAEGFPGRRFYAGCENIDAIESAAAETLKKLFQADHAYVQPHSGADANLVAYLAILLQKVQTREVERLGKKTAEELSAEEYESVRKILMNQKVMGLALSSGGHLTHGYRHNISAKMMQSVPYEVDPKTGLIDYAALANQVKQVRPLILLAGYSSYSRLIDFAKMREIADSVDAVLFVDMAHFSGLVAGKVMEGVYNPVPFAHIVTSTTHKTLRGPRGGFVLCKEEFKDSVNKGCPMVLGGPLPHVIGAKLIAFEEASQPEFQDYAKQVALNAKILSDSLMQKNVHVVTGGTDNHLLVFDVMKSFGLTGRQAEVALSKAHLTVNRNLVPFDQQGPWHTSGIRIGTAAMTTLGMKESQMQEIGSLIVDTLKAVNIENNDVIIDPEKLNSILLKGKSLRTQFPLYPELITDL